MKKIELHNYHIIIENTFDALKEFVDAQNYSSVFVLVDEHTKQHCLPKLQPHFPDLKVIEILSGENHKNIATCEIIWKQLMDQYADRKALLFNLGGGVIGDMGGFAAATYKRGIDFIQIPTTVLSQVDSSIGGKLGVDFKYGKNLVGLFKDPRMVYINPDFLTTLAKRQYANGFAEIFKHALIKDARQWNDLKDADIYQSIIAEVLHDSLLVKKEVVEQDPYEAALRKILNFGHTIGHAIEAYSLEHDEDPLLHGEAIALGMIAEAWLSVKRSGLTQEAFAEIRSLFQKHFPKKDISGYDKGKLLEYMKMDKKNTGTQIRFALLKNIGECVWDIVVDEEEILEALETIF